MSKKIWLAVLVAVILISGGALAISMHDSTPKASTSSSKAAYVKNDHEGDNNAMAGKSTDTGSSGAPASTNSIKISNFAFSPASMTVKKGTAVTWMNMDSATHTVTENDGQTGPDSGDLATGKSYSFTFATAGTFKYHCSIHPDMLGTVTVTE